MKNSSLVLFAVLILLGWTALAAGVIAVFAGNPEASARVHQHVAPPEPPKMFSDAPCPAGEPLDASVPCPA